MKHTDDPENSAGAAPPPPPPPPVALDPSLIPASLRDRAQWVCWKRVVRAGKETKCPVGANGGPASATDDATWSTFEVALAAHRADGRTAGIGFVFAPDDGFTGIDLDGCIGADGTVVASAQEVIDALGSYTEISPSGRGVKVFIIGTKPEGAKCKSTAIAGYEATEVYSDKRYFTVTSRHLAGTPLAVNGRQPELDALCARLWPKKPARTTGREAVAGGFVGGDDDLVRRAGEAKNGNLFKRLWAGDTSAHNGDDSGADLALCNLLAFWTGNDAARMDRLFRKSGLMREKWDGKRGERTYAQMTIDRAIADCTETYKPRPRRPRPAAAVAPGADDADGPPIDDGPPEDDEVKCVALGARDPETKRLVLSPNRTLPTADAYIRQHCMKRGRRTLISFGSTLMEWRGNRYCLVEDEAIKQRLLRWLHLALRYVYNKSSKSMVLSDFESNPRTVASALDSIRSQVHLPANTKLPSWLGADRGRVPVSEVLTCATLNLHMPTGRVFAPTPDLFTFNALEFDHDPDAPPPERWLRFLDEILGDDVDGVQLLQEWFGYCLTSDSTQQKALLVVGPRRAGKGTIGRVLRQLVGAENGAAPTMGGLAGNFGIQPLIGKSVAIVNDARFSGPNIGTVVERLLNLMGDDPITIDRKHLPAVTLWLKVRFTFFTNEVPRFTDSSTALAGRFLVLRLTNSFYGMEDPTLTEQLTRELPGILLWAIEGWKRFSQRGRFVQPESAMETVRDLEDTSSPVAAFVRECCVVDPLLRVNLSKLYEAWVAWCRADGAQFVPRRQEFGRDLAAAAPKVTRGRGTGDRSFYQGIALKEGMS